MPKSCDICGVEPSKGLEFPVEWVAFRGGRSYCPVCHRRFIHRVYLLLAGIPIICGLLGAWETLQHHRRLLDSTGVWLALLYFAQWSFVIPHELGHALAAKWLGYRH